MFEIAPLPRTLAATLRDAQSKRIDVRKSVLRDLVRHVDGPMRAEVVAALGQLLRADPDVEIRVLAAVACADGGVGELVSALVQAVSVPSRGVTQFALLALGELASSYAEVCGGVLPYVQSPLPALRYQAISTVCQLDGDGCVSMMMSAIRDVDPEVQWLGWHWLARFRDASVSAEFQVVGHGDEPNRWASAGAEVRRILADPGMTSELFGLLSQSRARCQAEGALTMLRVEPERSFAIVAPILESRRGLSDDQMERLINEFGVGGCRPSVPWLTRHAKRGWFEGRYGWSCLVALARLGERDAKSEIVLELQQRQARRTFRALEAIRELHLLEALGPLEDLLKSVGAGPSAAEAKGVLDQLRLGEKASRP